jgi:DNA sulfur modification protein DndE
MKPPVETVRISQQGRDQLIKLKRATGIEHWNTMCRWALCVSLREPTLPVRSMSSNAEGGVEIAWRVFAGDMSEVLSALVYSRAIGDSVEVGDSSALAAYFRDHVHRGLGYLASGKDTSNLSELFRRWLEERSDRKTPDSEPI